MVDGLLRTASDGYGIINEKLNINAVSIIEFGQISSMKFGNALKKECHFQFNIMIKLNPKVEWQVEIVYYSGSPTILLDNGKRYPSKDIAEASASRMRKWYKDTAQYTPIKSLARRKSK